MEEANIQIEEITNKLKLLKTAGVLTEEITEELNIDLLCLKNLIKEPEGVIPILPEINSDNIIIVLCKQYNLKHTGLISYKLKYAASSKDYVEISDILCSDISEQMDIYANDKINEQITTSNRPWIKYSIIGLLGWLLGIICMA